SKSPLDWIVSSASARPRDGPQLIHLAILLLALVIRQTPIYLYEIPRAQDTANPAAQLWSIRKGMPRTMCLSADSAVSDCSPLQQPYLPQLLLPLPCGCRFRRVPNSAVALIA